MKIFVAALGAETNSFVPFRTTLETFRSTHLVYPEEEWSGDIANNGHAEFIKSALDNGHEVVRGTLAYSEPFGEVEDETYLALKNGILSQIKDAAPFDIILLNLHGAMISQSETDCEGDLLASIRRLAGKDTVIGALLDLHAHLSEKMIASASILIPFKEYPHIDFAERARALYHLCEKAAYGVINPQMRVADCRSIGAFPTTSPPMSVFVQEMRDMANADQRVLDVSLVHSFPWGDSPDAGVKALAITNDDPSLAEKLSEKVRDRFLAIREEANSEPMSLRDGVQEARQWQGYKPLIIADTSDNPGGGAPGDATFLLTELIRAGINGILAGAIVDPFVVKAAFRAGLNGALNISVGGKMSPQFSGQPLNVDATVTALNDQGVQHFGHGADRATIELGRMAGLRSSCADIAVCERRTQTLSPDAFRSVGFDPANYRIVLVKSSNHFRALFENQAGKIISVGTMGSLMTDFTRLPYRRIPAGLWPID